MSAYQVRRLADLEERPDGECSFRAVRHELALTAFGATSWTGHAAGDRLVNPHDDDSADEELFVVLSGRATFEIDGARVDAPAGTLVAVPPGADREAFAADAATTVLLVEGTPGRGYDARGWELWAPLAPLYEAGGYAEVADRLRAAVAESPQYAMLFYNLACCESRTGRTDEALRHLGTAVALAGRFTAEARDDPDLEAARRQPGFDEVVGR